MTEDDRQFGERGSALIPAVVFAIIVAAYVASILLSGVAWQEQTRSDAAMQQAQQAAESGVHFLVAKLSGPDRRTLLADGYLAGTLRGRGPRAVRYEATLWSGAEDGADNDVDGFVDEEDESDVIEVASAGFCGGATRTVYVTLLARYRKPAIGSATYIADPLAPLDLDGSAFLISGQDVDIKEAKTGTLVPGIGVNGTTSYLREYIKRQQQARVVGLGESPSVHTVPELDLQALIEEGARSANVILEPGGVHRPAKEEEWGTLEAPAVVYSSGSVKIGTGTAGAGVLLVNGDLTITGDFEWRGVVIVRGAVMFKGGGGGKRVVGALVVEKEVSGGDPPPNEPTSGGVRLAGTVDIIFSEQIVSKVGRVLARYTVLNWREGPAPAEKSVP
jgi:hypothetical protein